MEVGTAIARALLGKLRFSNDETEQILSLIENHMRFKDVGRMKPATLKRFVRLPQFGEHLDLHRLDCLSSNRNLAAYDFVRDFVSKTPPEVVRPARLLTGTDLLKMGFVAGPDLGRILAAVEEAQLNLELSTVEEAKSFVEKEFGAKRGNDALRGCR